MADESSIGDALVTPESTYSSSGQPPRKRRRPALSCEQCRKRKIKCDRNYPCNHCTQSKSATCTYSSDNATAHALEVASTGGETTFPSRPKKQPSSIASSTQRSSITTSPRATTVSGGAQSTYQSPHTDLDLDEGLSRQALLERIRVLERDFPKSPKTEKPTFLKGDFTEPKELFFHGLERAQLAPETYEGKHLRGTVSKTRFFGQSHWMYSFGAFERIACVTVDPNKSEAAFNMSLDVTDVKDLLEKCKAMARAAKADPHKQWLRNPNYRESIPPKEVADKLVKLYFRTSESIHRILHIPTFEREYMLYWENPDAASTVFVMKLMLVMSIGACFYQGADSEEHHNRALKWIFAAQSWLSTPFEKARLHISGVQIHCLVLIARLDNAVAGDLIWISAGALLRTAFQMGFHRDPKHLPPMSQLHTELRRRLWATILEINVQSALDSGMPPLLTMDDYDTEPPANIDDIDIEEDSQARAVSRPSDVFTQTSIQLMLRKSLGPRLEVIRHSNSVRRDATYEEALAVSNDITKALKENNTFITRINSASLAMPRRVSQLDRNILDLSIRRFLLTVHRPFAAKGDPRYYFSRKVCLDSSMTILSYPSSDESEKVASPGYRDDYTWLKTMSGGFQKGFIVHAAMIIFNELLTQIEEDDGSSTTSTATTRETLKQALRDIIELAAERIKLVENNVKGHLFISIVLAQVEAMEAGINPEQAVVNAAKKSLAFCLELLKDRIRKSMNEHEYAAIVDRMAPHPMVHGSHADIDATGPGPKGILSSETGMHTPVPIPALAPGTGLANGFNFGFGMGMGSQDWGNDFGMQDWNGSGIDTDFTMPDSWLLSGWEDGNIF